MLKKSILALPFLLPILCNAAPNPNDGEWDMSIACETVRPHPSGHHEVAFHQAKIVDGKGEFSERGNIGPNQLSVEFEGDEVHLKIFAYSANKPSWFSQLNERGQVAEHESFHFFGKLWPGGRDTGVVSNCVIDGVNLSRRN
jgi:hypothetical protein